MGEAAPGRVRVRVPGKVNLFLQVGSVRADGYHELVTVLQTVTVHDTLVASLDVSGASAHPAARRFMGLALTADGRGAVSTGEENLVMRAARLLMSQVGIGTDGSGGQHAGPVTRLHLTKRIPVAAGMAGGSADAAAALVALNRLWQADLDRAVLRELGAALGADVPFCVGGGTALATGIGTATAQVLTRGTYHWVVGVTRAALSTPEVYRAYDAIGSPTDVQPDAVLQALRTGDAEALGAALHNDLEVAALHLLPELAVKRDALLRAGALGAIVSGSGPTIVGLAASAQDAAALAAAVEPVFDRVEIALSPAGGPEVTVE